MSAQWESGQGEGLACIPPAFPLGLPPPASSVHTGQVCWPEVSHCSPGQKQRGWKRDRGTEQNRGTQDVASAWSFSFHFSASPAELLPPPLQSVRGAQSSAHLCEKQPVLRGGDEQARPVTCDTQQASPALGRPAQWPGLGELPRESWTFSA